MYPNSIYFEYFGLKVVNLYNSGTMYMLLGHMDPWGKVSKDTSESRNCLGTWLEVAIQTHAKYETILLTMLQTSHMHSSHHQWRFIAIVRQ